MLVLVACVVVMTVLLLVDLPFLGDAFSPSVHGLGASGDDRSHAGGRRSTVRARLRGRRTARRRSCSRGWSPTGRSIPVTACRSAATSTTCRPTACSRASLSMPTSVLGIEGYEHDGKSYMYFGPAPALLRLPDRGVHRFARRPDRRKVSMAVRVRGGDGRARPDRLAGAALGARRRAGRPAATSCSPGGPRSCSAPGPRSCSSASARTCTTRRSCGAVALAFAAFAAILAWIEHPRPGVLAAAGVLTLLALLSRLAVGIGPAAALGAARGRRRGRARRGRGRDARSRAWGSPTDGLGWGTVGAWPRQWRGPARGVRGRQLAKFGDAVQRARTTTRRPMRSCPNGGRSWPPTAARSSNVQRAAHQPRPVPAPGRVPARRRVAVGPVAHVAAERDRRRPLRHARPHVEHHRGDARRSSCSRSAASSRWCAPARGRGCGRHPQLARAAGARRRVRGRAVARLRLHHPRYTADFLPFLVLPALAGLYAFVALGAVAGGATGPGGRDVGRAGRARGLELPRQRLDRARLPARPGAGARRSSSSERLSAGQMGSLRKTGRGTWRSTDIT